MTLFDSEDLLRHESDLEFDVLVKPLIPYINALARKSVIRIFGYVDLWEHDVDDIVQQTLIQLWLAYRRTSIGNIRAYARRIVHHETINVLRRRRPDIVLRLQRGDDGEVYLDNQLYAQSQDEASDPQRVVEQQEQRCELMTGVGEAVSDLPAHQRDAMICELREKIDEGLQFIEAALQKRGVDSNKDWPEGKREKQRLQASLSPARRKLKEMFETYTEKER